MNYQVIGKPHIESEYTTDEYETVMSIKLRRADGVIDHVWIVAGVPASLQGTAKAAGWQQGFETVEVFGTTISDWCPEPFQLPDEDGVYMTLMRDVTDACRATALAAHRERLAQSAHEQESQTSENAEESANT